LHIQSEHDQLRRAEATGKHRKHKIDLAELEPVFDHPMISVEDDRERYGELRLQSLGMSRQSRLLGLDPTR